MKKVGKARLSWLGGCFGIAALPSALTVLAYKVEERGFVLLDPAKGVQGRRPCI